MKTRIITYKTSKPYVIPMPIIPAPKIQTTFGLPMGDIFVPRGLAMWGFDDETQVQITVDACPVFPAPVPAAMFGSGLSFEELYRGLEMKQVHGKAVPQKLLDRLRGKVQWRELEHGLIPQLQVELRLDITGPVKAALFWGYLFK